MSLSINVEASNASNNISQFQQKPMAISSLTSSSLPNNTSLSPTETNMSSSISSSPSSSHKNESKSPSPPFVSSSPSSPSNSQRYDPYKRHSYQPSSTSYPFQYDEHQNNYATQRHYHELFRSNSSVPSATLRYSMSSIPATRSSSISSVLSSSSVTSSSPLSLQERRQRNKAASAKYRAKKNQQHGEMRVMISTLTKENDLLQRQLEHIRRENERLKATCDKYRGKILAEKMLKKLFNVSQPDELAKQISSDDDDDIGRYEEDDEEIDELCSKHA
jgi:hypothetical protein